MHSSSVRYSMAHTSCSAIDGHVMWMSARSRTSRCTLAHNTRDRRLAVRQTSAVSDLCDCGLARKADGQLKVPDGQINDALRLCALTKSTTSSRGKYHHLDRAWMPAYRKGKLMVLEVHCICSGAYAEHCISHCSNRRAQRLGCEPCIVSCSRNIGCHGFTKVPDQQKVSHAAVGPSSPGAYEELPQTHKRAGRLRVVVDKPQPCPNGRGDFVQVLECCKNRQAALEVGGGGWLGGHKRPCAGTPGMLPVFS